MPGENQDKLMSGNQPEVQYAAFLAIDWADQKHVWSLHMVHFSALTCAGVGLLQAPDVLLVRPINGQKSCILDFGLVSTHELVLILSWHTNVLTPFYDSVSSLIAAGCFVVRNPYSRVMGVMVRRLTVSEYSLQQSASRG